MKPFPEILTANFRMRCFTDKDLDVVYYGLSHPDVIRYYGISYSSKEETKLQLEWFRRIWLEKSGCWWAIEDSAGKVIGALGFNNWTHVHNKAEMGYWLLPQAWGQGILRECVPALLNFALNECKIHRVEATVEIENQRSINVLNYHGFKHEGRFHDAERKNGKYITIDIYALINPRF